MAETKLIIGDYNYSSWSMRPGIFIRYHNLGIEIQRLLFESEELAVEMSHRFSNGKVPLLVDGGLEVWDTLSILEYLGEKYPETKGWPESGEARAVARSISAEMHSSFQALRNEAPMNCRRFFPGYQLSDAALKDINRIQQLWRHCRENYGADGPWLFGDFTIADAMYIPVVMRFRSVAVSLDPVSQAYCDTVNQCQAVIDWIEQGKQETHIFDEDELDWPSEEIQD